MAGTFSGDGLSHYKLLSTFKSPYLFITLYKQIENCDKEKPSETTEKSLFKPGF